MTGQVRSMTEAEVQTLLEWAATEGWNPGVNDAACFWKLDPDGFLAMDVGGRIVGGGAIIRHNPSFGFMGLFIVHPDFRGQQLGSQLWHARRDRLLERLDSGATIGLDGVDAMLPFYERGGFRAFTRHRRFEFTALVDPFAQDDDLVDLSQVNGTLLSSLDRQCFPGDRSRFLGDWIRQPGAVALGLLEATSLQGFGVMRPCRSGWKIGPLFADNSWIAERLLKEFWRHAPGQAVYLDVPDNNPDALRLCRDHGMTEVFGCTRMYLGPPPDLAHEKIFGITTLEVG